MPGKKKYLTLLFIVVFTLSGTGLPLLVHLCNTMNEVSFESCAMCGSHNNSDEPVFSRTDDCCNTTQVSASITDQYISSKSYNGLQLNVNVELPDIIQTEEPKEILVVDYSGVSPPVNPSAPLFIINSSFLI